MTSDPNEKAPRSGDAEVPTATVIITVDGSIFYQSPIIYGDM